MKQRSRQSTDARVLVLNSRRIDIGSLSGDRMTSNEAGLSPVNGQLEANGD